MTYARGEPDVRNKEFPLHGIIVVFRKKNRHITKYLLTLNVRPFYKVAAPRLIFKFYSKVKIRSI